MHYPTLGCTILFTETGSVPQWNYGSLVKVQFLDYLYGEWGKAI
jgi:hypothetical protein